MDCGSWVNCNTWIGELHIRFQVKTLHISRGNKGVNNNKGSVENKHVGKRSWTGSLLDRWMEKCMKLHRDSPHSELKTGFCLRLILQAESMSALPLSFLSSFLWEFSDLFSSFSKQQQSYFYISPGDNTLSSDRPPRIYMLTSFPPPPQPFPVVSSCFWLRTVICL